MGFELTPKQMEAQHKVLLAGARHCLLFGGARSTKTFLFVYAIVVRGLLAPGSRHLISRLHHVDVRQKVMMDTFPKVMLLAFPDVPYALNRSEQVAYLPEGAEIWFSGLDENTRVDKVLGAEYATIFFNEASQLPYETVTTVRTRMAQNVKRRNGSQLPLRCFYDLNPVGQGHWTFKEFVQGLDPITRLPIAPGTRAHMLMNPVDNPHLLPETLEEYAALPVRQRARFYEGRYSSEVPGALWPLENIETSRVKEAPAMGRIVVAVDPSGSDGVGGDSQGIIVAGRGLDGHAYILADRSCRMGPSGWAREVAKAYTEFGADRVVAEVNYGGAMVESTIRMAEPNVAYKQVTASRGKHIRAEPVAALYESVIDPETLRVMRPAKVHHVGEFRELEEQMGMMTTTAYAGAGSPDRLDALVWAVTELLLGTASQGWLDYAAEKLAESAAKRAGARGRA